MRKISTTKQFEKDVTRVKKQRRDIKKLGDIIEKLARSERLPAHNRHHKLKGNYVDRWECHIAPDWLLIYKNSKNEICLERTGSHSDLFK
ncbi:MAG: mRNA interferase toxin YafQ [Chlamydiales bacterium]|nr:mRNA interferase toxin YafQ [Chlamydiales bacterium]